MTLRPDSAAPDWLTARPIAHRGLHDIGKGIVENTPSAVAAAIARGYGIEVDLQLSADGEAMVHHDAALGRLTEGSAALASMTAEDLRRVAFKATADRMMTLCDLLDMVTGRVTLLLELKSAFDGDTRLAARVATVLAQERGPVAAMSFDPDLVAATRAYAPHLTRGIVAERHFLHGEWEALPPSQRISMTWFLHVARTRPDFVAYRVHDLGAIVPRLARSAGVPLLTWTVRTDDDRAFAATHADQMIFEGFVP